MKSLRNERGQLIVEAVLLMAFLISISMLATKFFRESQVANNLISKPWATLAGMIECGTWSPCGAGKHPSAKNRNLSLDPEGT